MENTYSDLFRRLDDFLVDNSNSTFQSGLAREEFVKLALPQWPAGLPEDLIRLYEWKNGEYGSVESSMLLGFEFLTAEESIATRSALLEYDHVPRTLCEFFFLGNLETISIVLCLSDEVAWNGAILGYIADEGVAVLMHNGIQEMLSAAVDFATGEVTDFENARRKYSPNCWHVTQVGDSSPSGEQNTYVLE